MVDEKNTNDCALMVTTFKLKRAGHLRTFCDVIPAAIAVR
jgi:hypothetical protein